jgi:hypothetical protein
MKHVGYYIDTEDGSPEDRLFTIEGFEDACANEGGIKPEYEDRVRKVYMIDQTTEAFYRSLQNENTWLKSEVDRLLPFESQAASCRQSIEEMLAHYKELKRSEKPND